MTSITFVMGKEDFGEFEAADNVAEYILDNVGLKGFCNKILINNKTVYTDGKWVEVGK